MTAFKMTEALKHVRQLESKLEIHWSEEQKLVVCGRTTLSYAYMCTYIHVNYSLRAGSHKRDRDLVPRPRARTSRNTKDHDRAPRSSRL